LHLIFIVWAQFLYQVFRDSYYAFFVSICHFTFWIKAIHFVQWKRWRGRMKWQTCLHFIFQTFIAHTICDKHGQYVNIWYDTWIGYAIIISMNKHGYLGTWIISTWISMGNRWIYYNTWSMTLKI
jgi:hypothetical protein